MPDRLHLLVCENLQREVAAAVEAEGFADVAVSTFPAHCNRPRAAWDALLSIAAGERNGNPTQLICGPCGDVPESYPQAHGRFHVLKVERCCHLFAGRTIVDGLLDEGAYPLIPGWLAHWQDYVDPSAPDPERSRAFRGESATSLVLLDTGVDASSPELLRDLAERADLPFRVIPVGLEYFRLLLTRIVLAWRLERDRDTSAAALADANRRSAGYATVVDLIGGLTRIMTEAEAIEHIFDVFTALFAPASMVYVPLLDGRPGRIRARPAAPPESDATAGPLAGSADDLAWTDAGGGFRLRIDHQGETLGVLAVDRVAFPEYREQYLNLGLAVSEVCGLAIANARKYEDIKRIDELLSGERERLAVTLRSIGDGVIATDSAARVVLLNEVAEQLTGWTQEEAAGKHLGEVFHIVNASTRTLCDNPVEQVLEMGTVVGLADDTALIARDGTERMLADSAAPIRDAHGTVFGVVLVFRDVTEQKKAEQFREEYLHTISHDLRNPLTHISATAQWLQRGLAQRGLELEAQRMGAILTSARRMNSMVQDLVESARLEAGRLELRKEPTDLLGLVLGLVERIGTSEDRQRIRLEVPEPVPPLLVDPQRLERAIVNLLTNGLRYSPADKPVTLRVAPGYGQVEIAVVDQGVGIPADEVPRLSTRYYRVRNGQRVEGLGLGLYITRLLVEAHGGRLSIESEVGTGSTFRLSLPVAGET